MLKIKILKSFKIKRGGKSNKNYKSFLFKQRLFSTSKKTLDF